MTGVLADLEDPDSGDTLLEAWSGVLGMLGSGSDYSGRFVMRAWFECVVVGRRTW